MKECIQDWWNKLDQEKRKLAIGIALAVIFILLLVGAIIGITNKPQSEFPPVSITGTETESEELDSTEIISTEEVTESEIESESESESHSQIVEKEDPQSSVGGNMSNQNGASVDISQVVDKTPSNETR